METMHRLAGVTSDTPDTHPQPAHPFHSDHSALRPEGDSRTNAIASAPTHQSSRASLPLHHQTSNNAISSHHPQLHGESTAPASHRRAPSSTDSTAEDFPWGPSHPCYPHPNPHCARNSDTYIRTRVIRVRRDWLSTGDLTPQFANLYPEILDPLVTDEEFRLLISSVNARLRAAFDPFSARAVLDSVLSVATGFLWDDVGATGAKRGMKSLEAFLDSWNARRAAEGRDVQVVQVRRTGFLALDFVVPDPGIDGIGAEEGEGLGTAGLEV